MDEVIDREHDQHVVLEMESSATAVRAVLKELKSSRDRLLLIRYYLHDEDKASICRDLGPQRDHLQRRAVSRTRPLSSAAATAWHG
ncbi:MAG: hypothetical protein WDO56_20855 [Gammaproteobacteria bacterium]